MYFITTKECWKCAFQPNIQYRTKKTGDEKSSPEKIFLFKEICRGRKFFCVFKIGSSIQLELDM